MTFEIEVGGRMRTVSVEALGLATTGGGEFRLTIDGEPTRVRAQSTTLGLSLLMDDHRQVDVGLVEGKRGEWLVQLPHVNLDAVVDGRRRRRGGSGDLAGDGLQQVVAPMPGRIVRLLVKPGDQVEARQGLVVIEAMKMENELRSPKAGTIKDVAVAEGDSVVAGRLLVVVE
jgi:acetyl/propionyl-CoA carboxylase alpha subunit